MSVQSLRLRRALALNVSNEPNEILTADDASWILTNAFLILTMQSGFGLLEAGYVSSKNVANIMVRDFSVFLYGVRATLLGFPTTSIFTCLTLP